MDLIKNFLLILVLFGLLFSCKSSRLFIESKDKKKSIFYLNIYNSKKEKKDTLLLLKNVYSVTYSPYEFSIGKIKNGVKYGKWYLYEIEDDSTKCYSVEKINKRTQETEIIWTSGFINRPFF